MPLYDYTCEQCGKSETILDGLNHVPPKCCGVNMKRLFSYQYLIKEKYPLWVDRMEDIHKAQQEHGERLRMVHPKEVLS